MYLRARHRPPLPLLPIVAETLSPFRLKRGRKCKHANDSLDIGSIGIVTAWNDGETWRLREPRGIHQLDPSMRAKWTGSQVAVDETVILLHPPLSLVGVSMWMERGGARWQSRRRLQPGLVSQHAHSAHCTAHHTHTHTRQSTIVELTTETHCHARVHSSTRRPTWSTCRLRRPWPASTTWCHKNPPPLP